MLVLNRKVGETLVIDENVVITVLSLRGTRVKLGINAANLVTIRRGELASYPKPITGINQKEIER